MKRHTLVCDMLMSEMKEGISLAYDVDSDEIIVFLCEQLE